MKCYSERFEIRKSTSLFFRRVGVLLFNGGYLRAYYHQVTLCTYSFKHTTADFSYSLSLVQEVF